MTVTKGCDKDCIKEILKMRPWLCSEEKLVACKRRKGNRTPLQNPLSLLCSRNPKSSRNPNSCLSLLSGPVWKSSIFQFGKCTRISPSGQNGQVCQYQYQLLHFPVCKVQLGFGLLSPQVPNNYFIFQKQIISAMKNNNVWNFGN